MKNQFPVYGLAGFFTDRTEEIHTLRQAVLHVFGYVELGTDQWIDQPCRDLACAMGEFLVQHHDALASFQKKVGQRGARQSMAHDKEIDHLLNESPILFRVASKFFP